MVVESKKIKKKNIKKASKDMSWSTTTYFYRDLLRG